MDLELFKVVMSVLGVLVPLIGLIYTVAKDQAARRRRRNLSPISHQVAEPIRDKVPDLDGIE